MVDVGALELRPLMPEDADSARALIASCLRDTRYLARALEQLERALQFEDPEFLVWLASEPGGALAGLIAFGTVAGARGVVKVHGAFAHDPRTFTPLVEAVRDACTRSGERMMVSELPDDTPFAAIIDALQHHGFVEEGRVPDFVREGVALRFLVWRP
jgi:hypothetical protein